MLAVEPDVDLMSLDEALNGLAKVNVRYGQIVEMRFFGGMRMEEIAELMQVSISTIERDWRVARAWLFRALTESDASAEGAEGQ